MRSVRGCCADEGGWGVSEEHVCYWCCDCFQSMCLHERSKPDDCPNWRAKFDAEIRAFCKDVE